jgi:hypothetical protein
VTSRGSETAPPSHQAASSDTVWELVSALTDLIVQCVRNRPSDKVRSLSLTEGAPSSEPYSVEPGRK